MPHTFPTHLADVRSRRPKAHDDRPSAAARGYGATWRKLRRMKLSRDPLCADCRDMGKATAATDVHHIIALRDGGANSLDNLQSLCHMHHSQRTGKGESISTGSIPGDRARTRAIFLASPDEQEIG